MSKLRDINFDDWTLLPCGPACFGEVDERGNVVKVISCWKKTAEEGLQYGREKELAADLEATCVRRRLERGEIVTIPTSATGSTTG